MSVSAFVYVCLLVRMHVCAHLVEWLILSVHGRSCSVHILVLSGANWYLLELPAVHAKPAR